MPVYSVLTPSGEPAFATLHNAGNDPFQPVAFFALERPRPDAVPVYQWNNADGVRLTLDDTQRDRADADPDWVFWALPPNSADLPASAVPLYEFVREDQGARRYATDGRWLAEGYSCVGAPLCFVWRNPSTITFRPR